MKYVIWAAVFVEWAVLFGVGCAGYRAAKDLLRARRVRAARRVLEKSEVTNADITHVLIRLLDYEDPEAKDLRSRLTSLRARLHGVTDRTAGRP